MKRRVLVLILQVEGVLEQASDALLEVFDHVVELRRLEQVLKVFDDGRGLAGIEGCTTVLLVKSADLEVISEECLVVRLDADVDVEDGHDAPVAVRVLRHGRA